MVVGAGEMPKQASMATQRAVIVRIKCREPAVVPFGGLLVAGVMASTVLSMLAIGCGTTQIGERLLEPFFQFKSSLVDRTQGRPYQAATWHNVRSSRTPTKPVGPTTPSISAPSVQSPEAVGPPVQMFEPASKLAAVKQRDAPSEPEVKSATCAKCGAELVKRPDPPWPLLKPLGEGPGVVASVPPGRGAVSEPAEHKNRAISAPADADAAGSVAVYAAGQPVLSAETLGGIQGGFKVGGLDFSFGVNSVIEIGKSTNAPLGASANGGVADSFLKAVHVGNAVVQVANDGGGVGQQVASGLSNDAADGQADGTATPGSLLKLSTELNPEGTGSARLAFGKDAELARHANGVVEVLRGSADVTPLPNGAKIEFPAGANGGRDSAMVENRADGGFALTFEDGTGARLLGEVLQSDGKLEQRIDGARGPLVRNSFSPGLATASVGNNLDGASITNQAEINLTLHNLRETLGNPRSVVGSRLDQGFRRDFGLLGSGELGR